MLCRNKTEVKQLFQKSLKNVKDETIDLVFSKIGGRLSYLTRVIAEAHKNEEMVEEICDRMINKEKEWLLHLVGLIPDHDDDVMDEQKVAACTHVCDSFSLRFFTHIFSLASISRTR